MDANERLRGDLLQEMSQAEKMLELQLKINLWLYLWNILIQELPPLLLYMFPDRNYIAHSLMQQQILEQQIYIGIRKAVTIFSFLCQAKTLKIMELITMSVHKLLAVRYII